MNAIENAAQDLTATIVDVEAGFARVMGDNGNTRLGTVERDYVRGPGIWGAYNSLGRRVATAHSRREAVRLVAARYGHTF